MLSLLLLAISFYGHANAIVAELRVSSLDCAGSSDAAKELTVSNNVLTLKKSGMRTSSSAVLYELVATANATAPLQATSSGAGYAITVDFRGTDFLLLFDTGSADTWVATSKLQCVNYRGEPFPNSYCDFGPLFNGSFPDGPVPDQNFKVSYGSGEFVTGETGLMDISVASISLRQQTVALVDRAYWTGDGETSGITGFAYRALTSSYQGDNPTQDNPKSTLVAYSPIIQTALDRGLFSTFSLAFERGDSTPDGYLALGGLPPVSYKGSFASTPIKVTDLTSIGRNGSAYSFYTIRPDGFSVSGGRFSRYRYSRWSPWTPATFDVIVDSGTTLTYLPSSLATKINSQFTPPAQVIASSGLFETRCNAVAPDVSISIGGRNFTISNEDLLLTGDLGQDPNTGLCITGIQASNGPFILGDTFLKNTVTVFDVGAGQMRFAAR